MLKQTLRRVLGRLLGRPGGPTRLVAPGQEAPDFRAAAHDGRTLGLADFRGRKLVLWFYPKADTPGCTLEGKGFCSRWPQYEARGVAVAGVSFDGVEANREFAAKFGFPYPLLSDTSRAMGLAYGACDSADAGHAWRITYVIDENGRVAHALANVDPGTHADEVLALVG